MRWRWSRRRKRGVRRPREAIKKKEEGREEEGVGGEGGDGRPLYVL